MITCRELTELLIDFLSGDLPPEHKTRIQKHLDCCPPCVTYLETYQVTIRISRQLPCQPMPPQLVQRLREALEKIREEEDYEKGIEDQA